MTHEERISIVQTWPPHERELALDGLIKSHKSTEDQTVIEDWIEILRNNPSTGREK